MAVSMPTVQFPPPPQKEELHIHNYKTLVWWSVFQVVKMIELKQNIIIKLRFTFLSRYLIFRASETLYW